MNRSTYRLSSMFYRCSYILRANVHLIIAVYIFNFVFLENILDSTKFDREQRAKSYIVPNTVYSARISRDDVVNRVSYIFTIVHFSFRNANTKYVLQCRN